MSSMRIPVSRTVIDWAIKRSGLEEEKVAQKWMEAKPPKPTLKQLRAFSKRVYVPFGTLCLDTPPDDERLPITDFRTIGSEAVTQPSPHLLDTLYTHLARQEWYRDYAIAEGLERVHWVNTLTTKTDPVEAAQTMQQILKCDPKHVNGDLFKALRTAANQAGVLVMVNGVVGDNTRRKLDVKEFRGFALSDDYAPLIFINGRDSKNGQVFTLVHELAHILLGNHALSNPLHKADVSKPEETWCNAVAAKYLVPMAQFKQAYRENDTIDNNLTNLANTFRVSKFVILYRLRDAGILNQQEFNNEWRKTEDKIDKARQANKDKQGGGDYYKTKLSRLSPRFATAVINDTLAGETLYTDAFRLLGIKGTKGFKTLEVLNPKP